MLRLSFELVAYAEGTDLTAGSSRLELRYNEFRRAIMQAELVTDSVSEIIPVRTAYALMGFPSVEKLERLAEIAQRSQEVA